MNYKKDDKVYLPKLKREGVVLEALASGEYRVAIGSLTLTCPAADLQALSDEKWKKLAKQMKRPSYGVPKVDPVEGKSFRVDLHGKTVAEAIPMVEQMIDRAIIADADKVEVVHGLGTGRLLQAVHAFLARQSVVKEFKLDENNPGVTWVYF